MTPLPCCAPIPDDDDALADCVPEGLAIRIGAVVLEATHATLRDEILSALREYAHAGSGPHATRFALAYSILTAPDDVLTNLGRAVYDAKYPKAQEAA